jgi:hypothetical protein
MWNSDPTGGRFLRAGLQRLWPGSCLDLAVGTTGMFGHEDLRYWFGPSIPCSWQISVESAECFGGPRLDLDAASCSFRARA